MAPKFRPDLEVSSFDDGEGKYSVVLRDPVSQKFYRLPPEEFKLLQSFDGRSSLDDILARLSATGAGFTREDASAILERADRLGLLLGTRYGTLESQAGLRKSLTKAKRDQRFSSVFFLFIPLWNPDKFLDKTLWLVKPLANRWVIYSFVLGLLGAIYLFIDGFHRLSTEYLFFFDARGIMYFWVTMALTKLLHEFAHSYVAKYYGLSVPQMGVGFLIFFPCLYCNTTDAWRIAERKPRIAIASAGIAAELALAVLATYVWYFTKPGIVNSLAFYTMTVTSVSTVLFNGCPFIRFDGYFILSDVLRIPNLMAKSRGYIKYLFWNRALGLEEFPDTANSRRERIIFTFQGIGTYCYRFLLYTSIATGVYYRFDKTIGLMLAATAFAVFIVRPTVRAFVEIYKKRERIRPRPVGGTVLAFGVIVLVVLLFVPISRNSVYPCFVSSELSQKLVIPLLTSVKGVFVKEGTQLKKGELLYDLDINKLDLELRKKEIDRQILLQEIAMGRFDEKEMARTGEKTAELAKVEHEIRRIQLDLAMAKWGIIAPFDGVVTKLSQKVQAGFQPGQGSVVGEFQSTSDVLVYALIPEDELDKVRPGEDAIIWLPIGNGLRLNGRIDYVRPYEERDLTDSPFSSRFGGEVATEKKDDTRKDVPLEPRYVCAVRIGKNDLGIPLGMTGRLAVQGAPKSLAVSWFEDVVKTFNKELFF